VLSGSPSESACGFYRFLLGIGGNCFSERRRTNNIIIPPLNSGSVVARLFREAIWPIRGKIQVKAVEIRHQWQS
jgi:hypothetical protein